MTVRNYRSHRYFQALLFGVCLFFGLVPQVSNAATLHIPGFVEVNQFTLPAEVPTHLGDVMFSDDGSTLYILGGSETSNSGVWLVPVIRNPSGTVTGFGAATKLFGLPYMDTSLEIKPGTDTLFFKIVDGQIGQRLSDGTIAKFSTSEPSYFGGLAFVSASLPNADNLLVSDYDNGRINRHFLADNGDGTFTPVLQDFYANTGAGIGDLHFVPAGIFKDDLMIADYNAGAVSIIDIDPATGAPVGGSDSPAIALFVSGLGFGPWGLEFDPISGDLFISNYSGIPYNGITQISGFPPPSPTLNCSGFMAPFDKALSLKSKVMRTIPVKMNLTDADGFAVTDLDITAPPVINVLFGSNVFGEISPDTDELLPIGLANDDNIFRYDLEDEQWIYNLGTKQFIAAGTYTVKITSGDMSEYTINSTDGACTQTFERLQ